MATLQGAIDELIAVVDAVTGINYAPGDPPGQINASVAAVVYGSRGANKGGPGSTMMTDLHDVTIAVVMPFTSFEHCNQVMLPFCELITEALRDHLRGRTSAHYSTFGDIRYVYGPIEWPAGIIMLGYLFTIENLKIQNTIT